MRPIRRNSDEAFRQLERLAASGDPEAQTRLPFEKITLGELAHLALTTEGTFGEHAAALVLRIPAALRNSVEGLFARAEGRSTRLGVERLSHEEILATLTDGGSVTRSHYLSVIEEEARALIAFRGLRRSASTLRAARVEAQINYSQHVGDWLEAPGELTPVDIFSNRLRPKAWAIADRLREILARVPVVTASVDTRSLGELGINDWPADELGFLIQGMRSAHSGGPVPSLANLSYFTVDFARQALSWLETAVRPPQREQVLRLVTSMRHRLGLNQCDCSSGGSCDEPGMVLPNLDEPCDCTCHL